MNTRTTLTGLALGALLILGALAQEATIGLDEREGQIRDRYEQVLQRTPMQDSAFDRVYQSYLEVEGVEAWVEKLTPAEGAGPSAGQLVLLGRIQERQFKTDEAITSLEKARELGVQDPQLDLLLGRLYFENGQDEDASTLLTAALDQPLDPEARGDVVRILGSLYLRQGKRDEAIAAWKRLTEDNPGDTFAWLELAEIYEDNRMWEEAIATYGKLAELSDRDPYQKCRALRAMGRAHIQLEAYPEAIATFEQALDLVAPGNWLFEDLKLRLVNVYQDLGDLEGLVTYLNEKLAQNPGDTEFRDLLAETFTRMAKFAEAEAEHKQILERDPGRAATYERLIALYERMERPEDVIAMYDALIERYPTEPDYLRRLGEVHLRNNAPELAKAAWRRVLGETPTAGQHAQLAEWLEMHEFPADAVAEYEAALASAPNREWTFRLATLKHANGEEEAARALWTSVLTEESAAAERAEVASILETFEFVEQAEPILEQAYAQEPDNLEIAHALAKNRMRQEKFEEAQPIFESMAGQTENEYFQERGEGGLLDVYTKLGILEQKKEEWETAVRENPDDPAQLMRLARLYARSGDQAAALGLYERCVELQPDNADYLHTLARAYLREHRTEEAIDRFRELIAMDANRAGGYYRELLDVYLKADFKDEAIQTAQKIVELSPSDAEAYLDLGQVYMNYQQHEEGLAAYRSALRIEPDEPQYHRQYGQALQSEQRYGEAQEAYRKMLDAAKEDDTRIQAVASLAQIYQMENKVDSLVSEFQGRVRNTPKRLAAYEELGAIYKATGDLVRSVEILENGYNAVDDKSDALKSLVRASYDAQDFERVVRYFEDLIALSGKASPYEYERLGKVYLQLGEVGKAKETWQRIVDEEPDDPKSYITLAKALRDGGFYEEAAPVTEQALEMDPHNYKLRYEYAQELAGHEEMGKAYEQLQLLLELGPDEEEEERQRKKEEREKQVQAIQRGHATYQRVYMFSPTYRPGRQYYSTSLRSGSFEAIRPQVISAMAGMAENSVGLDAFIDVYKKRVEENPQSLGAHEDLIMVYEHTNRMEEVRQAVEELAKIRPNDVEVLDRLAVQYSTNQEVDKALEVLARIDAAEPTRQKSSDLARIYLLYRAEKKDEGRALVQRMVAENSGDIQVLSAALNVATQFNEVELIEGMRESMEDLEPRYRYSIQGSLARAYTENGKMEEARAIYEEFLFEPDPEMAARYGIPRGSRVQIYAPDISTSNQVHYYSSGMYQLRQQGIVSNMDYQRASALEQIAKMVDGEEEEAFYQRIQAEAGKYTTAESKGEREEAWTMGLLFAAHLSVTGEHERARAVLAPFLEAGIEDAAAYNLSNYLEAQQDGYGQMMANYAELRRQYPAQARDIAKAEASTLMLAERYDEVVERIQELARRGMPPNDLVATIQLLKEQEKPELARTLLEEQLSGLQRNPQALAMLAEIYAGENDHEKAMELAREAWERQARGGGGRSTYYYAYSGYFRSSGMSTDQNLRNWYQYAKEAGKADELVAEFEERLEKQPSSVSAHEQLASVYSLAGDQDKAIDLYKDLAEKRPHYVKAQTALAQLYEQAGQYRDAIALYESFLKTRPSLYNSMSWQVRRLYQRVGKGDELEKIEEDLVKQARTPDQLQQLAYQFRNSGEYDKAIELYEKVVRMEPNQPYYRTQLADVLEESGQPEKALELYAEWFDSPVMRAQGYIDQNMLNKMVGQYKAQSRLEELKAKNNETLADKPEDIIAKSVKAHIAMAEHRFEEAGELLYAAVKARQDPNAVNTLLEIGEYQGNAIEMVERLEADGMFLNYWNQQELAKIYLAAGNREKAFEYWKQYAERQGQYGLRQVMQGLHDFGLYEEAEDFYLKNRKKTRDMDNIAMEMYLNGQGFETLVQEMLKDEVKGLVAGLVESMVDDSRTSYARGVEILTPLLEREPENEFLLEQLAALHEKNNALEAALPYRERAFQLKEHDTEALRKYADLLGKLNREEEAFALYDKLLDEKRSADNAQAALAFFHHRQHPVRAAALRDRVAADLDAEELRKIDEGIARYFANRGHAREYTDLLKARFEEESNEENFNHYLNYLIEAGFGQEAYELCLAQAESGLLTERTLGNNNLLQASVQFGNVGDLAAVLWPYLRHGERWQRDNQLRQVTQGYRNLGYGRQLLDALRDRALAENPPFTGILEPLANQYVEVGDGLSALALIDTQLAQRPYQRSLKERKISILQGMERHGEAIALQNELGKAAALSQEARDEIRLAGLYFAADEDEAGNETLTHLAAWNRSSAMAGQVGKLLLDEERYAEALPYLEAGMSDADQRRSTCDDLVRTYLELGDVEKARNVWQENLSQRGMQRLSNYAHEDVYGPLAKEIFEEHLSRDPLSLEVWGKLGDHLFKQGDDAGARDAFQRALDAMPAERKAGVIEGYGGLLAKHGKLAALLDAPPLDDPVLVRALAYGYAALPEEDQTEERRTQVLELPLDDAKAVLHLANHFRQREENEAAAAQYERALAMESITPEQKLETLQQLVESELADDAAAQVLAMLREDPSLVASNQPLITVVARHGDAPLLGQCLALLRERQPEGESVAFFEKLAAYHAGGEDPALLADFIASATLEDWQWRHLAALFNAKEAKEAEASVLERIAEGGFGTSARDRALAELCMIQAESGDVQGAFARFLAISPDYGDMDGLMATMADHVTAGDLGAMETQVLELAAARPGNVVAPDYIGRLSELAERAGVEVDLEARLAQAPLNDAQRRDALQWARLVEGWLVSPPIALDDNDDTFMDEDRIAGVLNEAGAPADAPSWTRLEASESLGVIDIGDLLFEEDGYIGKSGAFAYTTIEQDGDGPAELTFSANTESAQVWINGTLVHTAKNTGRVRPGQVRFKADLKSGENHVVVKSQNSNKRWLFCLGPVVPGPPLPEPAPAAEEAPEEQPAEDEPATVADAA